jgi:hypothetical protein
VQERTFKMQCIGDDISAGARNIQAVDHQVFADAGVRDEADLGRLRR